jgi:transposase
VIRRLGFSRKRTYARAPDTERIVEARQAFCNQYRQLDPASVISVDETCLYFHSRHRNGYAPRGKRLHVPLHAGRHDKYTLLLAVSNAQVIGWQLLRGSANSQSFASFVSSLHPGAQHKHMLMDNVAFHKCKVVAAALSQQGLQPLFSPPYSPEYNPVEMAWHHLSSLDCNGQPGR